MLQSFALQNSSPNFKNTKQENVTHFINVKGRIANTSGKLSIWLHKLVIQTHFKCQIQYVRTITCKIRLISTKYCLI